MTDANTTFSQSLIQAISDWQRGGSPNQKKARAEELENQAQSLPLEFRSSALTCFRQIALKKDSLCDLAETLELPESISAWTISPEAARQIKGGVPPEQEYQGVIFVIPPPDGSVIVNLDRLFRDDGFCKRVEQVKGKIERFGDGMGRYGNDQMEVVIKINKISLSDVFELGGYSSNQKELAMRYFGQLPTEENTEAFDRLMAQAKRELGATWLGGDAKERVIKSIRNISPKLRTIRQL